MRLSTVMILSATVMVTIALPAGAADIEKAEAELADLTEKVPEFEVLSLAEGAGEVTIEAEQALTVDNLRGVTLDDDPPVLKQPPEQYPKKMTDSYPAGEAPYVADGIAPFRFEYFDNEFSYGGWHTWAMSDYASAHGFNVLSTYRRQPSELDHLPERTQWLQGGGFVSWEKWMKKHDIGHRRYDRLADMELVPQFRDRKQLQDNPQYDYLMIDMEHGLIWPKKLRKQKWYPADAPEAERKEFERNYYKGYAKTYTAPVRAAKANGCKNVSVYGWQPFSRTYWGLEEAEVEPESYWRWNAFGKRIYRAVDILNPSVYCLYWSPKNVAYTLANLDLNMKLIESMAEQKPVHPYYWTLLHGGGGGDRWWKGQPMPNEDARAMTTLCFFAGCEGMVSWNWSGTGNHNRPNINKGSYVMVGESFELQASGAEEGAQPHQFERYDPLHINAVDDGTVRFQLVRKKLRGKKYGLTDDYPVFEISTERLAPYLRTQAEPVAGMVEGLALVKPIEYILSHGDVKIDVSAQKQFDDTLPIVRRVKLGKYHLIATYGPRCAHGGDGRSITLKDFAGQDGRTLTLPADGQTRIFVLREQ